MTHTREQILDRLGSQTWDVLVIGGGATGFGAAVDAASRGYRTLLLEQSDFAKGTSSRSTKLIHGGVRYLRQGNIRLVRESLHERGLLLKNAAGLVQPLEFIIPTYSWKDTFVYSAGMKMYDLLAGRQGITGSRRLRAAEVCRQVPTLNGNGLHGGVSYFDAQFDDARLVVALANTLQRLNGATLNYMPVISLTHQGGQVHGVVARDAETGREWTISSKVVINAAGVFADHVRRMDQAAASPSLRLSQGIHITLDRSFLPGTSAIIVPHTDDGRVLFLIPWQGVVLVGTTDTPVTETALEPVPLANEIDYLLEHAGRYLVQGPTRSDIRSTFAGLRPLVKTDPRVATSKLSRDHVVETSSSGLVTVTGGKWTTFRKMGVDAIDAAAKVAGLSQFPSRTASLSLTEPPSDSSFILTAPDRQHPHESPSEETFDFSSSSTPTDTLIRRAVREEMARTVEDVLARRTRLLFLDAAAARAAAPRVAEILAEELGRPREWADTQVEQFNAVAQGYSVV